jgi:hypothetical protein
MAACTLTLTSTTSTLFSRPQGKSASHTLTSNGRDTALRSAAGYTKDLLAFGQGLRLVYEVANRIGLVSVGNYAASPDPVRVIHHTEQSPTECVISL